MLRTAMWRVSHGLSVMAGRTISNDAPQVKKMSIPQVTAHANGPETERVGIYLVLSDGLHGQTILILSKVSAMRLVDLLISESPGTTTDLGILERSALAEVGNLAVSSFLNTVATHNPRVAHLLRPSPPAVMVDMLGAILDVIVTPVAAVRDDLLIIETNFRDAAGAVRGRFWILPDPAIQGLTI
jgi:chemotaxis protein CheC